MRRHLFSLLVVVLLVGLWLPLAQGQRVGETVLLREAVDTDLYAAGRQVHVLAPINGDLTAAARILTVDAPIGEDLNAAAEILTLRAPLGDDLRAAARRLIVGADVADHMVVAADTLTIEPGVSVGGFAWIAADSVAIEGSIGGDLRVMAREFRLAGQVAGDVEVSAESIELLPGARIGGSLIWRSRSEPAISAQARVEGPVIAQPTPADQPARRPDMRGIGLLFLASLLVTAAVLYLVFPRLAQHGAMRIHGAFWKSLGLGFAWLAAVPLAIVLLFVTVVGSLLALLLLALYLLVLPLGYLLGAYYYSDLALSLLRRHEASKWLHLLALLLVLVLLFFLQWVPLLGALLGFAALLLGLGGALRLAYRAHALPNID